MLEPECSSYLSLASEAYLDSCHCHLVTLHDIWGMMNLQDGGYFCSSDLQLPSAYELPSLSLLVSLNERTADLCSPVLLDIGQEPQGLGGESRDSSPGSLLVLGGMPQDPLPGPYSVARWRCSCVWVWMARCLWVRAKDTGALLLFATGCRRACCQVKLQEREYRQEDGFTCCLLVWVGD